MRKKGSNLLLAFAVMAASIGMFEAASAEGDFVYEVKGKRDPFVALVTSDGRLLKLDDQMEEHATLSVEGVIFDTQGLSYALVDGGTVKTGDYVGTYQVLRIEPDRVVFIREGETFEVMTKKEE